MHGFEHPENLNKEKEPQYKNTIHGLCQQYETACSIEPKEFQNPIVKRGLRNTDGSGVVAGITKICSVHGFVLNEGEREPVDGSLTYRGYSIDDLVNGVLEDGRFGFEEICWLLMFGELPTNNQLEQFNEILSYYRNLPDSFEEDIIVRAPSPDIMNKLACAVLNLYPYDKNPEDTSLENVIRQCIEIIARMPVIMVSAYQVKRRIYDKRSMYFHKPKDGYSTAENILRLLRSDKNFTQEEAKLLDILMILHAEHGGGNNSTFSTRVTTSTGTDTYSAIASGICSLKGPKHGGANHKVTEMLESIKENLSQSASESEIKDALVKIIRGEIGDYSGLVYGMGHAVYTKSDPRAIILKDQASKLVTGSDCERDFHILTEIERLTPTLFQEIKHSDKVVCANIDLYSGLVYRLLKIPQELTTPMFAISRTPGWCAHRMEELETGGRIIRPAYRTILLNQKYTPMQERYSNLTK